MAEDLDVVVQAADESEPERRDEHQLDVDVVELAHQQRGNQDGQQDEDAAHGRGAALLELSFEPQVANLLADLLAAQQVDDAASEDDDDEQCQDDGRRRPEGEVLEHARAREVVGAVEVLERW